MCTKLPCKCSCQMYKAKDEEQVWDGPPGGWFLDWARASNGEHYREMLIRFPYGSYGTVMTIPVYLENEQLPHLNRPTWKWDGNESSPTLTPSIRTQTSRQGVTLEEWHGYVTAGRLVSVP